ncbi:unnamed protein product [Taenia asiatica]|uniref:Inner membrane protein n=1 Tax=Taenia asiatica TaxID=60517 RepID=A0A0R3W4S3_TAEAS|nr:unnamed protein product [Taenia asiatica]
MYTTNRKDVYPRALLLNSGLHIKVFGFSNVALWAASLWFLWKETPWFRGESGPMQQDPVLPEVDGAPL